MLTPEEIAEEAAPRRPRWRAFRAIRHSEYRMLFVTQQVNQLGFWISFVALQALMARLTGADGRWLGVLFFVNFIPLFVFTPLGGMLADRLERRRIMVAANSGLAVVMAALATVVLVGAASPVVLLPFAFGIGTAFSFNGPAAAAVTANAVPTEDLNSAISMQSMGMNLSRVIGPTLAAPMIGWWGEGAAFAIYAGTNVIAAVLLARIHIAATQAEEHDVSFWARLRGGIDHARERPPALAALALLCASSLFASGYLALLPVLASEVFDRGPTGFTTLAAVTGFGSMLGAFTTGLRDAAPTLRSVSALVLAFGASSVAFSRVTTWPAALVMMVVIGLFYFAAMTQLSTLLQHLSDDSKRGRVMALYTVGWGGLVPIAGLWEGIAADRIGTPNTIAIAGSVTALYALATLLSTLIRRPA